MTGAQRGDFGRPVTAPAGVEAPVSKDRVDDLWHTVCDCDEDTAFCGVDVSGDCWADDGLQCVVCDELDALPCARCGQ